MMRLDRVVFETIKREVEIEAERKGIGGFLMVSDFITGMAMFSLVNRDSPLRIGVPGKNDANFAAVAGSKFGFVFAHRMDTGQETTLIGELPFKGGHISADDEVGYLFSGARQEEDLELMQLAERVHESLDEGAESV